MIVDALRQSRAAALLLFRYLARRPVRGGAGPTYAKSRAPWFILLSGIWTFYVGSLVWTRFDDMATAPDATGLPAMAWQLIGVVLALTGFGMVELAPELSRIRPPLRIALLDELPFTTAARIFLVWFRNPFMPALAILATLAWSPAARGEPGGVLALVVFALALYLAAMTVGYAFGAWVRVLFSGRGRRAISVTSLVLVLVGMQILIFSNQIHEAVMPPAAVVAASHALRDGHVLGPVFGIALAAIVVALAAIALAERKGYDRLDAYSSKVRRGKRVELDVYRAEHLMTWREGGLGLALIGWLWLVAVSAGTVWALLNPIPDDVIPKLALAFSVMVAYLGAIIALSRAGQAVRRDASSRAFLAPLPIAPFQTLTGKVQAVRRVVLPLMLACVPWVFVGIGSGDSAVAVEVAWRSAATALVVWIGCDAAVSIAFLTGGVGLPGVKSMGAPTSFAVQLLLLPLITAAASPSWFVSLTALVAVYAIAREARRAAHLAVRWLDDTADDLERETTVWRALLALAAFIAAQQLSALLLSLSDIPPGVSTALVIASAGAVLVLLTFQGRRGLPPLRWLPPHAFLWVLGPLAGALSGLVGLGFAALLQSFGMEVVEDREVALVEVVAMVIAAVGIAPIVEEIFFRGWLQDAIANDLPPDRKRWAFAIAALAFALVHLGSPIVPQLVMGLLGGFIYARWRALLPTMLAHATHNGLVIALAPLLLGSQ